MVDGEIAKHVTIARRKGDDWFAGTVTNTKKGFENSLNFYAGKNTKQVFIIVIPFQSSHQVSIKRIKVDVSTVLDTKLITSGGQAIWIKPL